MTTDQPTPPSSLEEARGIAELDAEWWEAHNHLYRERRIHPSDADHDRATMTRTRLAMNAAIRAAARAEVIREVETLKEALVIARAALVRHRDYCDREKYVGSADIIQSDIYHVDEALGIDTDAADYNDSTFMSRLRALSQGGEG